MTYMHDSGTLYVTEHVPKLRIRSMLCEAVPVIWIL